MSWTPTSPGCNGPKLPIKEPNLQDSKPHPRYARSPQTQKPAISNAPQHQALNPCGPLKPSANAATAPLRHQTRPQTRRPDWDTRLTSGRHPAHKRTPGRKTDDKKPSMLYPPKNLSQVLPLQDLLLTPRSHGPRLRIELVLRTRLFGPGDRTAASIQAGSASSRLRF